MAIKATVHIAAITIPLIAIYVEEYLEYFSQHG